MLWPKFPLLGTLRKNHISKFAKGPFAMCVLARVCRKFFRVSQTCLGRNVPSGLVPGTFFRCILGHSWSLPCGRGRGAPGTVPLHNLRVTSHSLHQDVSLRLGHTPSTAGTFRKKFRKNSGKTPQMLSERFLEFPSRVRLGSPKPDNSRHLRLPEHFQNSLLPSTAADASFFRSGSGEGLSKPVMEFPAGLGIFLTGGTKHASCEIFLAFARGVYKRGEGAPLVRYLCKTQRSLHRRHV